MQLCAVQLAALKGDLAGNLRRHLYCIEQAAQAGAQGCGNRVDRAA